MQAVCWYEGTDYVGTHTDEECDQDGDHEDFWGTRDKSRVATEAIIRQIHLFIWEVCKALRVIGDECNR